VCRAAAATVDIEAARKLLDGPTVVLDIRLVNDTPLTGESATTSVTAATVLSLLQQQIWLSSHAAFALFRPAREYDEGHITKPVKRSASVPFAAGQDGGSFVAAVSGKYSKAAKLIVVSSWAMAAGL
jgi:hypothetical protein